MILFIEHIGIEGPGTIETYFKEKGFQSRTIALHKGERFPEDLSDIEAVICLGGPMNVYEEDKHPFLKEEDRFIQKILRAEIPFMGICLGSQLLSKACGAQVVKSPVKEVGWFKTRFEAEGKNDPLFANVGEEIDVYHWHEDMWELPPGGKLLAVADGCPHQAFKVGKNAYGLQFHVEITGRIIEDWCKNYFASSDATLQKKAQDMIEIYKKKKESFNQTAWKIYDNFSGIIAQRNAAV